MKSRGSELTAHGFTGLIESIWQDEKYKIALQVVFLVMMSAISAFWKKNTLDLGISGSSAVLWLGPMVLARMTVRRKVAGTFTGATVALWGLLFNLKNPFIYNLALYGGSGLALDVAASIPKVNIKNIFGAIFCGMFAHMVKFGFIVGAALTSTVVRHFMTIGVARAAGLHLLFGASAGLTAWLIYKVPGWLSNKKKA